MCMSECEMCFVQVRVTQYNKLEIVYINERTELVYSAGFSDVLWFNIIPFKDELSVCAEDIKYNNTDVHNTYNSDSKCFRLCELL